MAITPFRRVLAANRGEIAVRIFRASTELGFRTVAIFSEEDRVHLHRYKADEAYLVGKGLEPVAAYLAEDEIVELAKRHEVDAIHPGYGLLSERASFARKCRDAGIIFVGPTPEVIEALGDKVAARKIAEAAGVPIVPGTPGGVTTVAEARAFAEQVGYPVIIKASGGGGGRGMRVVRDSGELDELLTRARSEARKAFGDDTVFLEKLVVRAQAHRGADPGRQPRQPRAPVRARLLGAAAPPEGDRVRARLVAADRAARAHRRGRAEDRALRQVQQRRHRRVPGRRGRRALLHRGQPAHPGRAHRHRGDHRAATWCRRRSGSPQGYKLSDPEIGIARQEDIQQRGVAIQVRVTAEDPRNDFMPDTGKITVYRPAVGNGIRLDDGSGYVGARVSQYYDSLLVKITASGLEWNYVRRKVVRALREFRIRGVKTNLAFLENVLTHPTFAAGKAHTTLHRRDARADADARRGAIARRASCATSGRRIVNGHPTVRGKPKPPMSVLSVESAPPPVPRQPPPPGTKQILEKEGPAGIVEDAAQGQARPLHRHDLARRAPVAAGDAAAHATTSRASPPRPRTCAPTCSRWRCGAARRSTSPTVSCRRIRGCGWRSCAAWSRT